MRYAHCARTVVEIGVAEGASAAGLHEAMPKDGTLYLRDPFHLSRLPALNFLKRAAKRAVCAAGSARTVWVQDFSHEAVRGWHLLVDFLFLDGDHREAAVERDWSDWSGFVIENGIVAFHDAREFPGGWTAPQNGPVSFVNRAFRERGAPGWRILDEVDSLVFVARESLLR
jgi:predicted O-methyltransferase YrrM